MKKKFLNLIFTCLAIGLLAFSAFADIRGPSVDDSTTDQLLANTNTGFTSVQVIQTNEHAATVVSITASPPTVITGKAATVGTSVIVIGSQQEVAGQTVVSKNEIALINSGAEHSPTTSQEVLGFVPAELASSVSSGFHAQGASSFGITQRRYNLII